jgi:hypothetical protein
MNSVVILAYRVRSCVFLTAESRVLDNLLPTHSVKKFPAFTEAESQYHVHKSLPLVYVLNPIHIFLFCFSKFYSNILLHLHLGFLSGLLPSGFLTRILYTFLISSMHVTFPTHLIPLDTIFLIVLISDEEYKLCFHAYLCL